MASKKRALRLVGKSEPVTLESIVQQPAELIEDEFEALLDEVSDEEFGLPEFKDDSTPAEQRAKLKEWTSQDFSNIYVRYRPHLERYARRWISNPSQVDEVVQDAFLYLMVTLPELDSEIGVLRFLKWKLRLICLDVIRASGRAQLNNIDDHDYLESDSPEASAALEQADDAAVVRLALSKLTPRHREVLLATMYEEKSALEVAQQVGLSENATRQLIFRARAAFKKALVGDIETEGMSAAAILSVAARKAAEDAKKVGVQAMVLMVFMVLAIGSYFSINGQGTVPTNVVAQRPDKPVVPSTPESTDSANPVAPATQPTIAAGSEAQATSAVAPSSTPEPSSSAVSQAAVGVAMNQAAPVQALVFRANNSAPGVLVNKYLIQTDNSRIAGSFDYSTARGMANLSFQITIDGIVYQAFATNQQVSVVDGRLVLTAQLADLVSPDNVVLGNTALSLANVRLEFNQEELASGAQQASLVFTPKK
ncbi:MAG: RNA polymerase sigma factor [Micrococcales bacterium]